MFYFLSWQIISIHGSPNSRYLIFLTHWAFIAFNLSLIVSALSVTAKFISVHFVCKKPEEEFSDKYQCKYSAPLGCCGYTSSNLSWYQAVHWLVTSVAFTITVCVCVLYWATIYSGGPVSGINANTHLVNAIVAIIDFCITGVPLNTLHFIYPMIFAAAYALVNGLYYAGTHTPVYPVTDYGKNLGLAIGVSLASVFVLFLFIHFVF